MYGLVNQGIKDLILKNFDEAKWKLIAKEANSPEDFVGMQYYDDALTYRLVGVVSKVLNTPAEDILKVYGQHWVGFTGKEGYGPIMDLFGKDFKSCLKNLNHLHSRMGLSLPHLKPPSFSFEEIDSKTFIVRYKSERQGLAPMVTGLFEGLAQKYSIRINVDVLPTEASTNSVPFKITLLEPL